ncbi:MAG: OmpA family protein [Ferruginibacter sp.]|nr:OmpA family protein [Ferruginibacter sp.]
MSTTVQDDYLVCGEYKEQINNKSIEHPGFITFQHENGNHYFAWVNENTIIMRSEAYPDADKMERGIKAILKNCDLVERYSVIEEHGAHLLLLWGGGDHTKHTGNRNEHSEIGRSCPHKTREELNALLQFKGTDFANKVVPITTATKVTPMASVANEVVTKEPVAEIYKETVAPVKEKIATAASYSNDAVTNVTNSSSSMGWLKWLLPLLLLLGAFLIWKGCNKKEVDVVAPVISNDTTSNVVAPAVQKVTVDTVTGVVNYDLGAATDLDLGSGVKLTGIAKDGFENTLVNFIKIGKIDTVNKKANWFNLHDVQFVSGKTTYATPKALQQIKNVGAILKANPNVVIKLGGYTDISGDAAKNKALSDSRAKQVMKDLIANGAAVNQIKEAVGYGSEFAEAKLGDKEGMARDRKTAAKVAAM